MYSNSDFENFFLRYKSEAVTSKESIQSFCLSNKVPYNLFEKWYKDTRHNLVPVKVEGQPYSGQGEHPEVKSQDFVPASNQVAYSGKYPYEQWGSHTAAQFEPRRFASTRGEVGGFMLSVTGLNKFYFLKDFHDMRCKYERVLSIIHQQLNREPEEGDVFIVMSKDMRKVRLFSYDHRSYSLFEKRFTAGYRFMQVVHEGGELIYSINWKDVVLLLESPVVKRLKIR